MQCGRHICSGHMPIIGNVYIVVLLVILLIAGNLYETHADIVVTYLHMNLFAFVAYIC